MRHLTFHVVGVAAAQGSKKYVGHGRMVESSKAVGPWRESVRAAALAAMGDDWTPLDGPLHVAIAFHLPRPKGHYGTGRNAGVVKPSAPRYPAGKPDIDKLTRAILDAVTSAGAWRDDSQVVQLRANKVWSEPDTAPYTFIGVVPLGGAA